MTRYVFRRTFQAAIIVLAIIVTVFLVLRFSAGDPARIRAPVFASPEVIEQYQRDFGTDRPIIEQLGTFLSGALRGDLGTSFRFQEPVTDLILVALPRTLALAGCALALSLAITVFLGSMAALRPRSGWAVLATVLATVGQSAPVFWTGALMVILFAVTLGWLPPGGFTGLSSLVLPTIAVALSIVPTQLRVLRTSMRGVLREEYIRTAHAFGLSERRITFLYTLKNASLPLLTVIGVDVGYLLSGVIVAEVVFAYPGIGELALVALNSRDYPLVQGITIFTATIFVIINLLIDLAYALVDPRIRMDRS